MMMDGPNVTPDSALDDVLTKAENAGFDVVDRVEIGDLSDVSEKVRLVPAAQNVKLEVAEATVQANLDGTYRQLVLNLRIVDGLDANGAYKNMRVRARACYYANPEKYTADFFKDKQHLVDIKKWLQGTVKRDGTKISPVFTVTNPKVIDDTVLGELKGQMCLGNIRIREGKDGYDPSNEVVGLKRIETSQLV